MTSAFVDNYGVLLEESFNSLLKDKITTVDKKYNPKPLFWGWLMGCGDALFQFLGGGGGGSGFSRYELSVLSSHVHVRAS